MKIEPCARDGCLPLPPSKGSFTSTICNTSWRLNSGYRVSEKRYRRENIFACQCPIAFSANTLGCLPVTAYQTPISANATSLRLMPVTFQMALMTASTEATKLASRNSRRITISRAVDLLGSGGYNKKYINCFTRPRMRANGTRTMDHAPVW